MKFCILTRPRSGSHMLASALDSHPGICCHGEAGQEKYPFDMGKHPAHVTGWIVQDFMIPGIDLDMFDKVIVLVRDLSKRKEYRGVHFREPTIVTQSIRDHGQVDGGMTNLMVQVEGRDHIIVNYDDMTEGQDIREIPERYAEILCHFLEVRPAPLVPLFYKPEVMDAAG